MVKIKLGEVLRQADQKVWWGGEEGLDDGWLAAGPSPCPDFPWFPKPGL